MTKEYTIQLMKLASGESDPFEGEWLVSYTPGSSGSLGVIKTTPKQTEAKRFPSYGDAFTFWKQSNGLRPDGQPNRLLTSWSVVIETLEESSVLSMWVVYDHPKDFPNSYVARRHEVTAQGAAPAADLMVSGDLQLLRDTLRQKGLIGMNRMDGDEPNVVEVWL